MVLELHYETGKKKGLKKPQHSKKKRFRKTCLNLLRLSKKELKSDLIKVCRYLHKEEISDNKQLFSLTEKGTIRSNGWKLSYFL